MRSSASREREFDSSGSRQSPFSFIDSISAGGEKEDTEMDEEWKNWWKSECSCLFDGKKLKE